MRAFVTGATGFVGMHLVRELVQRGWSVTALVRDSRKARVLPPGVLTVVGDLGSDEGLQAFQGQFDVVFHLGAAISGDLGYHQRITVEGTRRLLAFARERDAKRFLLVSSLAVYDKSGRRNGEVLTERSPVCETAEAAGPYAWGKLLAEELLARGTHSAAMDWVIARPGLIYGPGHLHFAHLGPKIGPVRLPFGGGSVGLPLVHVDSVVQALITLAEKPGVSGRVFNIVDEEQPSKRRYLRELSQATGRRVWCGGVPAWPLLAAARAVQRLKSWGGGGRFGWLPSISPKKIASRLVECRYDCTAMREAVGWKPAYSLAEGLRASLGPVRVRDAATVERVGIIGAGRMAEFHLRALKAVPGVRVTGILDQSLSAAQAVAERHGIPLATDDAERFYREAQPQVVHVLTPPVSHAPLALEAIDHGCHVLLEKPMVQRVEECDSIIEAARDRGVTVGIDHNYAMDPGVRRARAMIDAGAFGEVVHIDIFWSFDIRRFGHALPKTRSDTTWVMQLPGGLLEDLVPHPLSLAMALANEQMHLDTARVFRSGRHPYPCDDEARLLLRARNFTVAINLTLSAKPDDLLVGIHGTRATVKMDVHNMTFARLSLIKGPKAVARGMCTLRGHMLPLGQTLRNVAMLALGQMEPPASVKHLVVEHYAALRDGRPLPVDGEDGRRIVEIVRQLWPEGMSPAWEADARDRADRSVTEQNILRTSREAGAAQPGFTRVGTLARAGRRPVDGSEV
jgi:predicted dehydrogenase/nucleoside-diphosphate-sugar epimerase